MSLFNRSQQRTKATPCPHPEKCGVTKHYTDAARQRCEALGHQQPGGYVHPLDPGRPSLGADDVHAHDDPAKRLGTAVPLGNWADGSSEWLEARRSRIGGSDVASVIGWSPWCSTSQLYRRKRGEEEPVKATPLMESGHYVEPAAAMWYVDHELQPGTEITNTGTWVHEDRDWQLANPDRIILDDKGRLQGIVEIKYTPNNTKQWGRDDIGVPPHYWMQTQWYMDTFKADWTDFAVLSGRGFSAYRVDRDDEWLEYARKDADNFMTCFREGVEPEDVHDSEASRYIQDLFHVSPPRPRW